MPGGSVVCWSARIWPAAPPAVVMVAPGRQDRQHPLFSVPARLCARLASCGRDGATGHDTVQVRMMAQRRAPGMERGGAAGAGPNAAIPDLDRYRSANVLVKHHAEDTPSEANVRTNAQCATITGDWEKPSGEFRLKDGEILWVRTGSDLNPVCGRSDPARFVGREPLSSLGASSTWPCYFW